MDVVGLGGSVMWMVGLASSPMDREATMTNWAPRSHFIWPMAPSHVASRKAFAVGVVVCCLLSSQFIKLGIL